MFKARSRPGFHYTNFTKQAVQGSTSKKRQKVPRVRYLFAVVLLSYGCLYFVTSKMTKKAPRTSFTEREFEQYEKDSGLKRRLKLVPVEKNNQYTFYAVPFAHDQSKILELLQTVVPEGKQMKVIHPQLLIQKEMEEQGKYSYLLEDLKAQGRSLPRGLVTALVKQEVQLFMNTTGGQYDTTIVLMNYPQTTEEAIKFENDVADVHSCVVASGDFDENLAADMSVDSVRQINNVVGYFDIVDKVKKI
ncbi:hypothetical protein METBIDRAFT_77881 [Metschnikowia bicuspidata var. bicuspidata NRRL YB-4993]|uniref:Altered inheritance of mitochondria protein 36, mitochondrial n=1 Tax=Metschnikowia bicuspidata var. bicuspidata NRRL YB-4993 TaxID=869754 RepID=A0A1A0HF30_9ASCO|nr:hypothetical protein METBIDRAFT_77881 [Metschnikowia bicuspidata var. bicuspidata NRRL YB-4993]OBA22502.1 hypothetical protein METBIDRAFT_77881 [Metschnikowia bicuspidata var. bicuspidata NRRL YB-4993]